MAASNAFHLATETADFLRANLPEQLARPRVAIVCGSGLGGLAKTVNAEREEFEYKDVPNFPVSTVAGHAGKLIFSTIGQKNVPVLLLVGRAHFYEGYSMDMVTFATRVCKVLGVETMLVTNAAGGLNPDYAVGDIVCLNDHLNIPGFAGFHSLRGPNIEEFGVRFQPLSDAYDLSLRMLVHKTWKELKAQSPNERRLHEGVYAFLCGPTYETRAEGKMLRQFGADVVGMSTVPEIVTARHCGMRVLALSLVTNNVVVEPTIRGDHPDLQGLSPAEVDAYLKRGMANHEEVLETGKQAALDVESLVLAVVSQL